MAGEDGGLHKEGEMDGQALLQPGGDEKEPVLLCSYNMPGAMHFLCFILDSHNSTGSWVLCPILQTENLLPERK